LEGELEFEKIKSLFLKNSFYKLKLMENEMAAFKNSEDHFPMEEASNYDLYERFKFQMQLTYELLLDL